MDRILLVVIGMFLNVKKTVFYDGWYKYLIEQYGEDWEKYEY